jgi:hypothetical protein
MLNESSDPKETSSLINYVILLSRGSLVGALRAYQHPRINHKSSQDNTNVLLHAELLQQMLVLLHELPGQLTLVYAMRYLSMVGVGGSGASLLPPNPTTTRYHKVLVRRGVGGRKRSFAPSFHANTAVLTLGT